MANKNSLPEPAPQTENRINLTQADLILDTIEKLGCDTVFGVPGGAIEPLYNALARNRDSDAPSIQTIISRHEAAAAYMAEGYARVTGKLGVCCATTGPGTTNLITAVASALTENIPMLVITAQTALPNTGRRGLQESSSDGIDTVAMLEHCTRYSSLVSHPNQLEYKLYKALKIALGSTPGPVHLSIPVDIMNHSWQEEFRTNTDNLLTTPEIIDLNSVARLQSIMDDSKKAVIYIGAGCTYAITEIVAFAEATNTCFITSPSAKGLVDNYHPLYKGVYGFAGHESAKVCLANENIDTVLAVGTRLNELSTSGWDNSTLMTQRLVHIDDIEENFLYSPTASFQAYGDIGVIFRELLQHHGRYNELKHTISQPRPDYAAELNANREKGYVPKQLSIKHLKTLDTDTAPLKPQRLVRELVHRLPDNCRFISDAGNSWSWTTHYLFPKPQQSYYIGMGFGAMAWGIGVSVGMAVADPDRTTVCITGDGSYLMSSQELSVAIQHQLPVVFVILNDSALGMVKHGQGMGTGEAIGFELPSIDFCQIAIAMGAAGVTVRTVDDFENIQMPHTGPLLIDAYIDPEQLPPMGARMKVLDRRQSNRRSRKDRRYSIESDRRS